MNKPPDDHGVNDDTLLEAYKVFKLQVATTRHMFSNNLGELVVWFVEQANAANLTAEVVTVLFGELLEIGAITKVHGGYAFSMDQLEKSRFAAMATKEQRQHLESLRWAGEIVKRNKP